MISISKMAEKIVRLSNIIFDQIYIVFLVYLKCLKKIER